MPTPELSADEVAHALSFLSLGEIMPLRSVNMTWKDAAKKTIVPSTNFIVNSVKRCNAMSVMARVLPNLQQVTLRGLRCDGIKYSDGEDLYEALDIRTAVCDMEIMSNFRKLRILEINAAFLNGRYPVLFNFPLLQKLSIQHCNYLKWDLDMLAGLPLLKELDCLYNRRMTGNINSLRVLKETLEKVDIHKCGNVEGNFMDLADFPHLKKLDLDDTAVTGDIRDIGAHDFVGLEEGELHLPEGVYGGSGYELQRISDGPDLVRAVYLFNKHRPALNMEGWYVKLSEDSPDWYESVDEDDDTPPFYIVFVQAGSRIGYRWETKYDDPCEVNWLDPEPEIGSSGYEDYVADYHRIRKADFYRGYYDPPSEEEYNLLHEEIFSESDEDED
jgi:hypothetical protein